MGSVSCRHFSGTDDWEELLLPEIERQQNPGREVICRADAAFAKPEVNEALEERGLKYAIRIPANDTARLGSPVHGGGTAGLFRTFRGRSGQRK